MPSDYSVLLASAAEAAYAKLHEEAEAAISRGNTSHPKVKLLRMVDECLDKLIPHEPLNPSRALAGVLANVYRMKKGRLRICYVVSPSERQITVLFISETPRKEGDKNDPYKIFTHMVMSGEFDPVFEKIGLKKPERRSGNTTFRVQ